MRPQVAEHMRDAVCQAVLGEPYQESLTTDETAPAHTDYYQQLLLDDNKKLEKHIQKLKKPKATLDDWWSWSTASQHGALTRDIEKRFGL